MRSGRKKSGTLWIKDGEHRIDARYPSGKITARFHGRINPHHKRLCCLQFETQAEFEISGLRLLHDLYSDLEE